MRANPVRYDDDSKTEHRQRCHGSAHLAECSWDDDSKLSGAEDVEDEQSEMIQLRAAGFLTSSGLRETRHGYEARNLPAFFSTACSIARRASTNGETKAGHG